MRINRDILNYLIDISNDVMAFYDSIKNFDVMASYDRLRDFYDKKNS